jgi:flagellar export protein FliJ
MRPFQFRLERLKRVRSAQERAAKADFGLALSTLNVAETGQQRAMERRDAAREELRHVMRAGNYAGAFLTAQKVTDRFEQTVGLARAAVSKAVIEVEEKRNTWVALRSKEEGLERLHATHHSEHRRETERQLSRELDEIAMNRAAAIGKPVSKMPTATDSVS